MKTTYNSSRRSLTVASMICEILIVIASGFFTLIFGVLLAFGVDRVEDYFSKAEVRRYNETFARIGYTFAEIVEAMCVVFIALFIIAAIFAVISIIVSAVNISRSKSNYVTFNGDAIFKIVINALWVLGVFFFLAEVPNVIYFILALLFAAPVVLSIIVLTTKLDSNSEVSNDNSIESDNSAEMNI